MLNTVSTFCCVLCTNPRFEDCVEVAVETLCVLFDDDKEASLPYGLTLFRRHGPLSPGPCKMALKRMSMRHSSPWWHADINHKSKMYVSVLNSPQDGFPQSLYKKPSPPEALAFKCVVYCFGFPDC